MNYITPAEAAALQGVTARRIQVLAQQGRIPGAKKFSGVWIIPAQFTVTAPPYRRRGLTKIRTQ